MCRAAMAPVVDVTCVCLTTAICVLVAIHMCHGQPANGNVSNSNTSISGDNKQAGSGSKQAGAGISNTSLLGQRDAGKTADTSADSKLQDGDKHRPSASCGGGGQKHPVATPATCDLYPSDPHINARVKQFRDEGTELLRYRVSFPEYDSNPLENLASTHYKPHHWQRVFSAHGETLLTLAFNYDVLSLKLLTFGEKTIEVNLVDAPCNCFSYLSEDDKVAVVKELVLHDFLVADPGVTLEPQLGENEFVCHQIIKDVGDGYGEFAHQCCTQDEDTLAVTCHDDIHDKVIDSLYIFMSILRILFLLYGPLFLLKWFYKESIEKTPYVVPLREKITKSLLLKKVRVEDDSMFPRSGPQKDMAQFGQFRQLVKGISTDEIVPIAFKKLHILVDHQDLISEKAVPVGLFRFLYDTIFMCSFTKHEPFASCCAESLFGSWSKRFLWFKLMDGSDCNRSCKTFCSWTHIFRFLGGLVLLGFIPLPYIIRVIVFYKYEEPEVLNRNDALDRVNMTGQIDHGLFLYLTPSHGLIITMYVLYILTYALLCVFRKANNEKFYEIIRGSIEDLRNVSYLESLRMLLAHLLLPFEKFGVVCGILVAAVYWPFALPFCLFTMVFYCTPSLYLTGRLLFSTRPSCLKQKPFPTNRPKRKQQEETPLISQGTTSFEECLLLNNISPTPAGSCKPEAPMRSKRRRSFFRCNREVICSAFLSFLVGLLCIINMFCLLFMYAEVVGVVAEVAVLSMMGTVVNASSAAKYVMLGFWILLYTTNCYNTAYSQYERLNAKIFAYIKDKLGNDIESVTVLPDEDQQHTAFKYFSTTELKEYLDRVRDMSLTTGSAHQSTSSSHVVHTPVEDVVADKHGRLYWDIKSLIMFVDNRDVPRIPRQLFFNVCEQDIPGCPGPVYKSMMRATKQLLYMVVFMTFVFIVVLSFGNIYDISDTNQLLLTLASGFLPFVVRFVLAPKDAELELNTYSFHGRIHQLIFTFSQSWQVYDLAFDREDRPPGSAVEPRLPSAGAATALPLTTQPQNLRRMVTSEAQLTNPPDIVDPTHVDLLITIRDEEEDANLRSEPGSQGSNRSINSGAQRIAPDDLIHPHSGRSISGTIHNPTNAHLHQIARAGQLQGASDLGAVRVDSHPCIHSALKSQTGSPASTPAVNTSPLTQPFMGPSVNPPVSPVPPLPLSPAAPPNPVGSPFQGEQSMPPTAPATSAQPSSAPQSPETSSASEQAHSPHSPPQQSQKRVDLVVDLAKGGVQVRGAEASDRSESSTNGIPLWTMAPAYKQLPERDGEAHL